MLFVGQGVDDVQIRSGCGQDRRLLLGEGPDDERADPSLQIPGDVLDRLALSLGQRSRQMEGIAAKLADRDLERRSSPQGRFFEEQRHVQAGQHRSGRCLRSEPPVGLHLRRGTQQFLELDVRQVEDRQEVLCEMRRCSAVRHVRYSPLMRTYSALRSQVQMVAEPCPLVPRLTSMLMSRPFRCSAARGAASSCGSPFSKSRMPPT